MIIFTLIMKNFKNFLEKFSKIIFPLLSIAAIIAVWFICAAIIDAEVILPSPSVTFKEFLAIITSAEFYASIGYTLLRAALGFLVSFVLAFIFAYFSYKNNYFKLFASPFVYVSRCVPTMSVILLCWLIVSPSFSPVVIVFISVFPISYASLLDDFSSLDIKILQAAKVYSVPNKTVLKKYLIPEITEKSFYTAINSLAYSIKLTVSAEAVVYAAPGLGELMAMAKGDLQTGALFAYTVAAVILGLVLQLIAVTVKKLLNKKRGLI